MVQWVRDCDGVEHDPGTAGYVVLRDHTVERVLGEVGKTVTGAGRLHDGEPAVFTVPRARWLCDGLLCHSLRYHLDDVVGSDGDLTPAVLEGQSAPRRAVGGKQRV